MQAPEQANVVNVSLIRGLNYDRNADKGRMGHHFEEGLGTNRAVAHIFVPVADRAARVLGIVGVHQFQPVLADHADQFVEGGLHATGRC